MDVLHSASNQLILRRQLRVYVIVRSLEYLDWFRQSFIDLVYYRANVFNSSHNNVNQSNHHP